MPTNHPPFESSTKPRPDVFCVITGKLTPIPARGPRSMYVNVTARELASRLTQVGNAVEELREEVGFTPPAQRRFRRVLSAIADVAESLDLAVERSPSRPRAPRLRVEIDPDLAQRIDALSGPGDRRNRVQALLLEALAARGA